MEHRTITDKDVKTALNNIKHNYLQDILFFTEELEREIMFGISLALQEKNLTHHELLLVINYLFWTIDNRSWLDKKQGYVRWLPHFFKMYTPDEEKRYVEKLKKTARRLGLSSDETKMLIGQKEYELNDDEKDCSELESEFFALDADKKLDFLVEHAIELPNLIEYHATELEEKKEYTAIEALYKKMCDISQDFPLFEFMLGRNYGFLKNPHLAKYHMENAIKHFAEMPDLMPEDQAKKMIGGMRKEMKKCLDECSKNS
jgi:hypothetical protein